MTQSESSFLGSTQLIMKVDLKNNTINIIQLVTVVFIIHLYQNYGVLQDMYWGENFTCQFFIKRNKKQTKTKTHILSSTIINDQNCNSLDWNLTELHDQLETYSIKDMHWGENFTCQFFIKNKINKKQKQTNKQTKNNNKNTHLEVAPLLIIRTLNSLCWNLNTYMINLKHSIKSIEQERHLKRSSQ